MGKSEIEVESGDSFKMDDRTASLYSDGNDAIENRGRIIIEERKGRATSTQGRKNTPLFARHVPFSVRCFPTTLRQLQLLPSPLATLSFTSFSFLHVFSIATIVF